MSPELEAPLANAVPTSGTTQCLEIRPDTPIIGQKAEVSQLKVRVPWVYFAGLLDSFLHRGMTFFDLKQIAHSSVPSHLSSSKQLPWVHYCWTHKG